MKTQEFQSEVSELIWDTRYRFRDAGAAQDRTLADTWCRVAKALASTEQQSTAYWEQRFYELLQDFRFLPGGRILAGAGTGLDVTLFNCFVMGVIDDSMEGIFDALKEGALTMQSGGGVGYDFSTLRPAGAPAWRVGGKASGPVSFMRIWDSMCETLLSTAARRGAMMATLRCDHPDIEAFIEAKQTRGELHNFNLSVLVSDEFMKAVSENRPWSLVFPVSGLGGGKLTRGDDVIERQWSGNSSPVPCQILQTVSARSLWEKITSAAYYTAEPGVLFIDRINRQNNLGYREQISATNPCGEIPLPAYGACNLGSINLTRFVSNAFSDDATLDLKAIGDASETAVRMLDNVIDLSRFPLPAQKAQAQGSRRIGLGITGLADALIMLRLHYGSTEARKLATETMRTICHRAYRASVNLAEEKGCFPYFERDRYLQQPFIEQLPKSLRQDIAKKGIRNCHLTAIAPAGTISLLAGNVSSGIEPVFDFDHRRKIRAMNGPDQWHDLTDHALQLWRRDFGNRPLPAYFVDARRLSPDDHLHMQAGLQPFVDNAISKTINVATDTDITEFRKIYEQAYDLGLKGCTTYRANPVTGSVLESIDEPAPEGSHCCGLDREND